MKSFLIRHGDKIINLQGIRSCYCWGTSGERYGISITWKNTSASYSFATEAERRALFEYISKKLNPTIIEVKVSADVIECNTLR